MKNEELLEKLYNGDLTSEERAMLETRVQDSPEFAQEVQEFSSVVDLMDKDRDTTPENTTLFDDTREKVIAAITAAAGTASIGGALASSGASGGTGAAASGILQWLAVSVGAIAVGSVVVWNVFFSDENDTTETPQVQEEQNAQVENNQPLASATTIDEDANAADVEEQSQPTSTDRLDDSQPITAPPEHTLSTSDVAPSHDPETDDNGETFETNNSGISEESDDEGEAHLPKQTNNLDHKILKEYENRYNYRVELGDEVGQANTLDKMTPFLLKMEDVTSALERAEESVALRKKLHDKVGEAFSLILLGRAERANRKYKESVESLSRALDLADHVTDRKRNVMLRGAAYGYLGLSNEKLNQPELALRQLELCVQLLKGVDNGAIELTTWKSHLERLRTKVETD